MAYIDHTIIAFKNGTLLRKLCARNCSGESVPLIPFSYSMDGEIRGYEMLVYDTLPGGHGLKAIAKRLFGRRFLHKNSYAFYADRDVEIISVKTPDYCATFYLDWHNTYIMLGGYGHHKNPYTHFYNRGYGEAFERKMALECYCWLCGDVLSDALLYSPSYSAEYGPHLLRLQIRLGFRDQHGQICLGFRDPYGEPGSCSSDMISCYEPHDTEPDAGGEEDRPLLPAWPEEGS